MTPTPDEIRSEPAGERLDAWVAELVMGWRNGPPDTHVMGQPYFATKLRMCHWIGPGDQPQDVWVFNKTHLGGKIWSPSTDIAAAWSVVPTHSRMFQVHKSSRSTNHCDFADANHWEWRCRMSKDGRAVATADSAPLAICRAALLAKVGGA